MRQPPQLQPPLCRRAAAACACLLVAVLCLLAAPASAYPESDAPLLRPDVLRAGHSPASVPPHTQWRGFLVLAPGSDIVAASYQVCRVGAACFAPPHAATRNGTEFAFSTADVAANAVDYQPGWHIGVKWILHSGNGTATAFPQGPDATSPACQGAMARSCQEQHYLTFDIAGEESRGAPPALAPGVALLLLGAARVAHGRNARSRRHG